MRNWEHTPTKQMLTQAFDQRQQVATLLEGRQPHARQAIACCQTAPPALQSSANQSQAQINLAICLAGQDQPDEGLQLAGEAIGLNRGDVEANLQQASEFLTALKPAHRSLPAARELADHLQSIRASRPALG